MEGGNGDLSIVVTKILDHTWELLSPSHITSPNGQEHFENLVAFAARLLKYV